jgi:hypothetical protein
LEFWARCKAGSIQLKVEKKNKKKQEAASLKLQAPSATKQPQLKGKIKT